MRCSPGGHEQEAPKAVLQIDEVARLAEALAGVRRTTANGLASGGTTAGWSPASLTTPMW
jgi:hypothetical protein